MLKARPGSKPSLQARLVAVALADEAGRALASAETARERALTSPLRGR